MKTQPEHKRRASKKAKILAYLMGGGTLTTMQAMDIIGTHKLTTRISELINKDGHTEIRKTPVYIEDRDGNMVKVMQYSIDPGVLATV